MRRAERVVRLPGRVGAGRRPRRAVRRARLCDRRVDEQRETKTFGAGFARRRRFRVAPARGPSKGWRWRPGARPARPPRRAGGPDRATSPRLRRARPTVRGSDPKKRAKITRGGRPSKSPRPRSASPSSRSARTAWRLELRRPSRPASRRAAAASQACAARHRSAARESSRRASAASVLTTAACRARSSGTSSSRIRALSDCSGARHRGHLGRPGLRRFDSAYSQAAHNPWPHGGAVVVPPRAHTAHAAAGATPHATRCDAQSSRWHRTPQ